jgi:fumarylpyruvate hydrolase
LHSDSLQSNLSKKNKTGFIVAKSLFELHPNASIRIDGDTRLFPVNRIFCVGRNYAEHAAEMGNTVDRSAPFYFTKSLQSVSHGQSHIRYPTGTQNYHHEVEFVVFIREAGHKIPADAAMDHVFGYACGLDMTRRDLQAIAKEKRRPWDLAKDVEQSAVIGTITPKEHFGDIGPQKIELFVNEKPAQSAHLSDMIHSVPNIICDLSEYYTLQAGDVIMTGTPAGVGPVVIGDKMDARIDGLSNLVVAVAA